MPTMWTKKYDKASINSNESNGTTTGWEGDFVSKYVWNGQTFPSLYTKYKDKEIGKIPTNTHVYTRIIKFWISYKCHNRRELCSMVINDWAGKIIIVEGFKAPVEYWNRTFGDKDLYISQEWLKNFITTEELAELTAIRMLGNTK